MSGMNSLYGEETFGGDQPLPAFGNDVYTDHNDVDPVKRSASIEKESVGKKAPREKKNKTVRKPLSRRNKIILTVGGLVVVAFSAALMTNPESPRSVNISANAPVAQQLPVQEPDATIMSSGAKPGDMVTFVEPSAVAGPVTQPSMAKQVDSQPASTQTAAQTAPAVSEASTLRADMAPASTDTAKMSTASTAAVAMDAAILARIEKIESKNKELEERIALLGNPEQPKKTRNSSIERSPSRRHNEVKTKKPEKGAVDEPVIDAPKMAVNDISIRVVGVTTKPGGAVAVIESGGIKRRYEKGDVMPGLGVITRMGIANGASFVEISGVMYH